jgi:hypothetical protein
MFELAENLIVDLSFIAKLDCGLTFYPQQFAQEVIHPGVVMRTMVGFPLIENLSRGCETLAIVADEVRDYLFKSFKAATFVLFEIG